MRTQPSWFYTQSGVIPYRKVDDQWEILLVTSRSGKRWIIPKGIVDPGLTPAESAAKEAQEEAGIFGTVETPAIGRYTYMKWNGTCRVKVFPMQVKEELAEWPEGDFRKRKWFTLNAAVQVLKIKKLKKLVKRLPKRMASLAS